MTLHVPPHDLDAEQAVLGSMMVNTGACDTVIDIVGPEDFYRDAHASIFRKISELRLAGQEPDITTVSGAFTEDELEAAGGRGFVCAMAEHVPAASNALHYARIIVNLALRRRLVRAGQEITEAAYNNVDADGVQDRAEALLSATRGREAEDGLTPMPELLCVAEARVYDAARGKKLCGRPTHLKGLNELVGGFEPGSYIVLAARPSMGKSLLAMNIARHYAAEQHVLFFSAEMSKEEMVDRLLACEASVALTRIRTGGVTPQDEIQLFKAIQTLASVRLSIDDTVSNMSEIQRRVRRFTQRRAIGLVVIDYIQLLTMGKGRPESRYAEVTEISRSIKLMAREHKVPVLALSQLNRPDTKFLKEDAVQPRPTLSSLRESGAIEQDADLVAFLYKPLLSDNSNVELIVEKSRNSATGKIKLALIPHMMRFIE